MPDDLTFTTVVLRFRDLVTIPDDTIRLHREIINSPAGGVWWGWWSKGPERIPDAAFRRLLELAQRADGLELFLMDSGTGRTYRARCRDLRWRPDHNLMSSPNADETPPYYRARPYLAWFRLTEIEPVDDAAIRNLTYVRIDSFFQDGTSRYTPFYGKKIHSIEELRQQERTIWFVRPAQAGDPTHEVSLLDPRRIAPVHFTREFIQHSSRSILWVSDTHLSADDHHGFPLESEHARSALGQAIENACKEVAGVEQVAGVWISGDLTWRAHPDEFALARRFVSRLQTWVNLDNYNYAICPGNHDVRFSLDPAEKDSPVTVAAPEAIAAYSDFYKELFYIQPNEFLCSGRRYLLGGTVPVEVVLVNSSLLQQAEGHFQGHGFVGDNQLRHVAGQFGWDQAPDDRPVRILIVHHHLLSVTFRELPINGRMYSIALDAEAIMRWAVQARVDLVLHGHMHQPFYSRITRRVWLNDEGLEHTIAIVGAGSAGVSQAHLGEIARNTFGLLSFHQDQIEMRMYSVHSVNPSELLWEQVVPLRSQRA